MKFKVVNYITFMIDLDLCQFCTRLCRISLLNQVVQINFVMKPSVNVNRHNEEH